MSVKRAAWIVWFVSVANITVTFLFFQRDPRLGTLISQLLALATFIAPAGLFIGSEHQHLPRLFVLKCVWAYLAFLGISLLWTAAPLVAASGYWAGVTGTVIVTYMLLAVGPTHVVTRSSLDGYFWGCVFVAVVAWGAGVAEDGRLGNLDYLHPNAYAILLGFAVLYGIYLWLNDSSVLTNSATIFLALTVLRSFSKTTIVALIAATAYYLFLRNKATASTVIKLFAVVLLLAILIVPYAEEYWYDYSGGTGLETLTGRTVIWATSADIALERPLLGNGIYSYRFVVPFFGDFEAWQAHNELLQQFFAYGLVGLVLSLAIYFNFWRHLRAFQSTPQTSFAFACLAFALIHGLGDATAIELALPLRFIVLLSVWTALEQPHAAVSSPSIAGARIPRTA